jgi:hypothetical protein
MASERNDHAELSTEQNHLEDMLFAGNRRRQLQREAGEHLVVRGAHAGAIDRGLALGIEVQRETAIEIEHLTETETETEADWNDCRPGGAIERDDCR